MHAPTLDAFLLLCDDYKLPDDLPTIIEYARDCVRAHIKWAPNNPERHIDQFCKELRMLPDFINHFKKDGEQKSLFGQVLEGLSEIDKRKIFLTQIVTHARLYGWYDYFIKHGYTENALRDKLTIFKRTLRSEKFGSGYEDFETNLSFCSSIMLAQELATRSELVLREGEDFHRTHKELWKMKVFEDNWWVARPAPQALDEKPAEPVC